MTSRQSRRSFVVIEQVTESRAAPNSAGGALLAPVDELVVETLMVPLVMIVGNEFSNGPAEMSLAERNQAIETLGFDGPHKPFRVGIRVGRLIRRLYNTNASVTESVTQRRAPFCVPVADQEATAPPHLPW
jgi:hypothetical protein